MPYRVRNFGWRLEVTRFVRLRQYLVGTIDPRCLLDAVTPYLSACAVVHSKRRDFDTRERKMALKEELIEQRERSRQKFGPERAAIVQAATDARAAAWFPVVQLPPLAFDHDQIVQVALAALRSQIRHQPIGFELLPERFTLTQLQQLYEVVLGRPLDKRNFRKKLLKSDILIGLDEKQANVRHRAAQLYRFDAEKYAELTQGGFSFEP